MPIAKGVQKRLSYAKESTWGSLAPPAFAKSLRRTTADFYLKKETYESAEIRTDHQVVDFRHGVRSVEGALSGELSPGSYSDFMSSILAKNWVSGTQITGVTLTIAASAALFTLTRTGGSWLTDGFNCGDVIRLSASVLDVANLNNNLLIVSLNSSTLLCSCLSPTLLVAEGPIAGVTITVLGAKTQMPLLGHTDDSYTIEESYSSINQSEVYTGVKLSRMGIKIPAASLATCDFSFLGKDLALTGTSSYFTNPVFLSTSAVFASVFGVVLINGQSAGLVTSLEFTAERTLELARTQGSNVPTTIFAGRLHCTGTFSVYYNNSTIRDYFNNENSISLITVLADSGLKNANVISFVFTKIKLSSAVKKDTSGGIIQDYNFVALLNTDATAGLATSTLQIQDSSLNIGSLLLENATYLLTEDNSHISLE